MSGSAIFWKNRQRAVRRMKIEQPAMDAKGIGSGSENGDFVDFQAPSPTERLLWRGFRT